MMRENEIISTGKIIKKLVHKYHLSGNFEIEFLKNSWSEIVGPELAKICQPLHYEKGRLTLTAKNSLWRQELGNKRKELLNSIKTKTKEINITSIDFS